MRHWQGLSMIGLGSDKKQMSTCRERAKIARSCPCAYFPIHSGFAERCMFYRSRSNTSLLKDSLLFQKTGHFHWKESCRKMNIHIIPAKFPYLIVFLWNVNIFIAECVNEESKHNLSDIGKYHRSFGFNLSEYKTAKNFVDEIYHENVVFSFPGLWLMTINSKNRVIIGLFF